jgi:hypothetical protein
MNWQTLWQRLTSTRYSRELESEVLRERAEAVRLRDELTRERAENVRFRAELVRERTENARLRTENRALLNSILGIAGIPPVLVDASAVEAVVPSRIIEMDHASDQAADEAASGSASMNRDPIPANPDRPRSPTPCIGNTADDFRPPELPAHAARENAAHLVGTDGFPAHASASAEITNTGTERPANKRTAPDVAGAAHRPIFSRTRVPRVKSAFDKQKIATPTRRRSWHQINRQLELASARKPVSGE